MNPEWKREVKLAFHIITVSFFIREKATGKIDKKEKRLRHAYLIQAEITGGIGSELMLKRDEAWLAWAQLEPPFPLSVELYVIYND